MNVQNILSQKYDVLYINTLSTFLTSPINLLYRELQPIRKDAYQYNERIVIVDDVFGLDLEKKHFFRYLYKILGHIDITNLFVLVVGNECDALSEVSAASKYDTTIRFDKLAVETTHIQNPTNYNIPDTVCVNPWINVAIFEDSRVSPCCLIDNSTLDTIANKSVIDIINNDSTQQLRKEMLQGNTPLQCEQCWKLEQAGKNSKRLNDNYVFRDKLFDIDWNAVTSPELISLDIKLKNTCNLSCRICEPRFSSKWYDEVSRHPNIYPEYKNFKNIEWHADTTDKLWRDIKKIGSNIRYITFAGGEPLLDKTHVKLLQYLIDIGSSSNTSLHYNTNGTIYADNLIPLWDKFKSVELSFSIDNTKSKFEYERYGANWENVVDNISKYLQLDPTIYSYNINNTVSILNILDSYSLFEFAEDNKLSLSFNILHGPIELNITQLSIKQKEYVISKLSNTNNKKFEKIIEPVLWYLETSPEGSIHKTINYLNRTDVVRGQNFKVVYQELAELLRI